MVCNQIGEASIELYKWHRQVGAPFTADIHPRAGVQTTSVDLPDRSNFDIDSNSLRQSLIALLGVLLSILRIAHCI